MTNPFKGYIFDVDGTLVDSNDAHTSSWRIALAEFGFNKDYDQIRRLIGMGSDKVLPTLTGIEEDQSIGKEIIQKRAKIFKSIYLPHLRAFTNTREMLLLLKDRKIEIALASSASREDVRAILEQANLNDIFEKKTSADDAARSKPDSDIVEATLKKMRADYGEVVMVGDTPYDIEAAKRAGLPCIAFRCGGYWRDPDFTDAYAVYDGPTHLMVTFIRREFENGALFARGY